MSQILHNTLKFSHADDEPRVRCMKRTTKISRSTGDQEMHAHVYSWQLHSSVAIEQIAILQDMASHFAHLIMRLNTYYSTRGLVATGISIFCDWAEGTDQTKM